MGWRFLKDFLRHLAVQAVGADDDLGEQFGLGAGEMLGCAVGLGTERNGLRHGVHRLRRETNIFKAWDSHCERSWTQALRAGGRQTLAVPPLFGNFSRNWHGISHLDFRCGLIAS